jgi:integrase
LEGSVSGDRAAKRRPQTLRLFKEFVELVNPNKALVDLTRADWKKYVDSLNKRKCKSGTINYYLATISGVLNSAPDHFPSLGEWRPPRAPWEPASLGRNRVLSADEMARLLAALRLERQRYEHGSSRMWRLEICDLCRLMILIGAREGEILNLRHSAISWDWKTVQITSLKGGGSRRVVPLSDSALEILKSREINAPRVFKPIPKDTLLDSIKRASEWAEITYGNKVEGGFVIYDLRHTAATVLENAGIPYSSVAAILGHKRRDQTATYTHSDMATMRRGVEVLEKWCREIDGFFSTSEATAGIERTTLRLANG